MQATAHPIRSAHSQFARRDDHSFAATLAVMLVACALLPFAVPAPAPQRTAHVVSPATPPATPPVTAQLESVVIHHSPQHLATRTELAPRHAGLL